MKIIVIPTTVVGTEEWGLWSNTFQCWMQQEFKPTKQEVIKHAKELGFEVKESNKSIYENRNRQILPDPQRT